MEWRITPSLIRRTEGRLSTFSDKRPVDTLNLSLQVTTERYGERTTNVVALQLEYPRSN